MLARADYQAVRVLGTVRDFAFVVTQHGRYGFMDPAQLRMTTRDEIEQYLGRRHGRARAGAVPPGGVRRGRGGARRRGGRLGGGADRRGAHARGAVFSPGYYGHFVKPLGDVQLYPLGLYQAPVYNSLLFRLWNSAGNLVQYRGGETEWAHIGRLCRRAARRLLFFAEYGAADLAVVPSV